MIKLVNDTSFGRVGDILVPIRVLPTGDIMAAYGVGNTLHRIDKADFIRL